MADRKLPKVLEDLIEELENRYPNRTEIRRLSEWEYGYAAGNRAVVDWIKHRLSDDETEEQEFVF